MPRRAAVSPSTAAAAGASISGDAPALERAATAILGGRPADDTLAREAGLRDAATLQRRLQRDLGISPEALASLGKAGTYRLDYGGPFHVEQTLRYLARDADNLAERVEGPVYRRQFPLQGRQVPLTLTLAEEGCTVRMEAPLPPERALALHRRLVRFLGLDQPLAGFYRAAKEDAVMGPLTRRLRGVRIPQVPSLWEALCWAVIGQQINLAFAYRLRNRLIALGNGLALEGGQPPPVAGPLPFPTPAGVLGIPEGAWREAQFSRQKTAYLLGVARAVAEGTLDEAVLEAAPTEAVEETLRAVRGLGPWSVAYGLLRALGRVDALPVGDAGLRTALRRHYGLEAPPPPAEQERLMEPFRPYRGLATYYFWKSLDAYRQE